MARAYVASGLLSNTCSNLLGDPAAGEEALVADDGRPGARRPTREEGAFVACTFWAVEALALTGQRKEAVALMEEALQFLGGAHLLSEMVEPHTGDFLGNLPQALSHLALINAASALAETAD
jgi:GH15 family glucan-1,4-alpha-glucosidase